MVLNNIDNFFPRPRVGDKWFMHVSEDEDLQYSPQELRLNRVRLHQQVLFLSDILCVKVKGTKIDTK